MHTAALALVLALTPLAATPGNAQDPPPIEGVVVDPAGQPIAGARYWISGFERRVDDRWELTFFTGETRMHFTDAQGRFELPGRADLRYDLDFEAPGRVPAFERQVEAGARLRVELRAGRRLAGRVVQLEGPSARPVDGARVAVRKPNPRGLWFESTTTSAADGRFEFTGLLDPRGSSWQLVCGGAVLAFEAGPQEDVDDVLVQVRITRE